MLMICASATVLINELQIVLVAVTPHQGFGKVVIELRVNHLDRLTKPVLVAMDHPAVHYQLASKVTL
jgi:hypothetical protein